MSSLTKAGAVAMFRELGVVFAGVLIALAADSAWELRQDRERLRANLDVLLADMEVAEANLSRAIDGNSAQVQELRAAYEILTSNDRTKVDELSGLEDFGITINPVPLGTLRLLTTGGDVRLLEDAEAKGDADQHVEHPRPDNRHGERARRRGTTSR